MSTAAGAPRIGVDLGGSKIHAVVLASDGNITESIRRPTPRNDYPATVSCIAEIVTQLDPAGELSVGIGTPGSWQADREVMQNCNSTWLNGRPLWTDLTQALGPRVRIANDANCFALSESHGGAADGAAVVFGAILGTGVGGGLVVDGVTLVGRNGLAGVWGHTQMPRFPAMEAQVDGVESRLASRRCYCGQLNCIETFLSGPGLALSHAQLWGQRQTAESIYAMAELESQLRVADAAGWEHLPGEPGAGRASARQQARTTLALYCRMLGRCLAQIVNVLDPDVIVLGGGLSNMEQIYQPVRDLMVEDVFSERCATRLTPPRFGDSSGVRGAAWLWSGESASGREC